MIVSHHPVLVKSYVNVCVTVFANFLDFCNDLIFQHNAGKETVSGRPRWARETLPNVSVTICSNFYFRFFYELNRCEQKWICSLWDFGFTFSVNLFLFSLSKCEILCSQCSIKLLNKQVDRKIDHLKNCSDFYHKNKHPFLVWLIFILYLHFIWSKS